MYIERYTAIIKDIHTKKNKKVKIDANTEHEAHKKALSFCNELTQDITKLVDGEGNTVYTINNGFVVNE